MDRGTPNREKYVCCEYVKNIYAVIRKEKTPLMQIVVTASIVGRAF